MEITVIFGAGALLLSIITLLLTFYKFGREVHVDDKREIIRQLDECKRQCDETRDNYERLRRENEVIVNENRRYREENYKLLQRIAQLNGGSHS